MVHKARSKCSYLCYILYLNNSIMDESACCSSSVSGVFNQSRERVSKFPHVRSFLSAALHVLLYIIKTFS